MTAILSLYFFIPLLTRATKRFDGKFYRKSGSITIKNLFLAVKTYSLAREIYKLAPKFIYLCDELERTNIAEVFNSKGILDETILALEGTHIKIQAPEPILQYTIAGKETIRSTC
ncbi:hypothetical protein NGRA_1225 [Nosema granulosis]|uniref:Uncharacterized protein n=1 Tax=Nosema granulosis TaxID=83296 RepID=A0A9P6GZU1_9MICR|nr:hypothetical protein NGRA_1225 [Nosema granulosis]